MNISKWPTGFAIAFAFASTSSYGAPSLTENTLSWPDDGWYQVQRADTFESVCEGGRSCELAAGTYIVINHSTGERFKNIIVGGNNDESTNTQTVSSLSVDANVISWPDDGWYQVQATDTFETICEGGRTCEVKSGSYVVINHTTGERFKDVIVGSQSTATASLTSNAVAPADISLTVYSTTAAELNWTPAYPSSTPAESNEIRRNGKLIATIQGWGARSYFDGNREPGQTYRYEITAIYTNDQASAVFNEAADESTQPDVIATPESEGALSADLASKLAVNLNLLNGTAVEKVAANALRLTDPLSSGLTSVSIETDPASSNRTIETYACPNGGTVVERRYQRFGETVSSFLASDCGVGTIIFDGSYSLSADNSHGLEMTRVLLSGVTFSDSNGLLTITMSTGRLSFDLAAPEKNYWDAFDLQVASSSHSYSASSALGFGAAPFARLPDGRFGMIVEASDVVNGLSTVEKNSISTSGAIDFSTGGYSERPTSGTIVIGNTSVDGDAYTIDFYNGDPTSFTFTTNESGSTTSYTLPWSENYRLGVPDPSRVELSF